MDGGIEDRLTRYRGVVAVDSVVCVFNETDSCNDVLRDERCTRRLRQQRYEPVRLPMEDASNWRTTT